MDWNNSLPWRNSHKILPIKASAPPLSFIRPAEKERVRSHLIQDRQTGQIKLYSPSEFEPFPPHHGHEEDNLCHPSRRRICECHSCWWIELRPGTWTCGAQRLDRNCTHGRGAWGLLLPIVLCLLLAMDSQVINRVRKIWKWQWSVKWKKKFLLHFFFFFFFFEHLMWRVGSDGYDLFCYERLMQ